MSIKAGFRNLLRYESVNRWISGLEYSESGISESTLSLYLYYLKMFTEYMGKNPDELIRERMNHLRSNDPLMKNLHDHKVREFANWLRENGASPNTVSVAVASIKSFYKYNYGALMIKQPRTEVVRIRYVPTRDEISVVVNSMDLKEWVRTWIVAQAQSGLSAKELRTIDVNLIKKELNRQDPPVIIPMYRSKAHVDFHAVFGEDSVNLLRFYIRTYKPEKILFPYTSRAIEIAVRTAFDRHINKYVTPHCLRKFFSSTLKTVARENPTEGLTYKLVEYWMGHSLTRTEKAYFVPTIERQKEIYRSVEHLISFL